MKSKIKFSIGQIVCDLGTFKDCNIELESDISVEDAIQSAKTLPDLITNMSNSIPALRNIFTSTLTMIKEGNQFKDLPDTIHHEEATKGGES